MFEIYRWRKVFESIKSDRLSSQLIYLVGECRLCVTDNVISSLTYVRGKNSRFTGRTSRSTTQTWWAMQDKKKCEEPKIYLNQQHQFFYHFFLVVEFFFLVVEIIFLVVEISRNWEAAAAAHPLTVEVLARWELARTGWSA